MVFPNVETLSAEHLRPFHDSGAGTVHIQEVKIGGSEVFDIVVHIPHHSDGFQKNFRQVNRRADIQQYAVGQFGDSFNNVPKIDKGCLTQRGAVAATPEIPGNCLQDTLVETWLT